MIPHDPPRRFRFRLKTLLVVIVILALLLVVVIQQVQNERMRRRLADAQKQINTLVVPSYGKSFKSAPKAPYRPQPK
jgi:hypothetical protein